MSHERMRGARGLALLAVTAALAAACGQPSAASDGDVTVVTTTEILADLVAQVGGDRVSVTALVPHGGDPHSYEPVPTDAVRISQADATFTNHLLLEPQALIKAIDNNAPGSAPNVSLAESSESYGANVIPLVEDLGLDVVWLGLRVRGDGAALGADRTSEIEVRATGLDGPGHLLMYVTEALGDPRVHFDSHDGLGDGDLISLPPGAHTHVNWAFTQPGDYTLTLGARLVVDGRPRELGTAAYAFAVGTDPASAHPGRQVIAQGHTDLTVDLDSAQLYAYVDPELGTNQQALSAASLAIEVPDRAIEEVPGDERFAFLGPPGARIHQLPQAVLGRHVHGEIDPHLWQDVRNARAYVQLIRDTLQDIDPDGAEHYAGRTEQYLAELDELDTYVSSVVAQIPQQQRQLVTTHDAFRYFADAYGMQVAGFVVPNPAQEPSAEQVRELSETIRDLDVPAVFLEPNLVERANVLRRVAQDGDVAVCTVYGDAFDDKVDTYVAMMRHNADEMVRCLAAGA